MILLASQLQPTRRFYRWVITPLLLIALGLLLDASWRVGAIDRTLALWGFPAAALIVAIIIGLVSKLRDT